MTIPPFANTGLLPVGTYRLTFDELRQSHLVTGKGNGDEWDADWRAHLVTNAEVLDGSFVETKVHPNDIDGYVECDARQFARGLVAQQLNAIDPWKVWTWSAASRRPAQGSMKRQLPMWHRYRVEFYPHFPGLLSGITDSDGNELQFPSAFRQQRGTGIRKGIVQIVR